MIILKHLTVERFRLLQKIDLHFPQRGSVLLQGSNEAGKSTVLESLYFALYGAPLHGDGNNLDDLIQYGAAQACASLTLSVATTELHITRSIERGKGQHVTLCIRKLGMPDEPPISDLKTANERIIAELGFLDGGTLRASYFIEQRGLSRLERTRPEARAAAISKLLGLEKLRLFTEHFKVTPQDEERLAETALHLKLAEAQYRIPVVSEQLGQIEAALDAITVVEALEEIAQQESEIAEQEQARGGLQERRATLKARQGRIQLLRKADTVLGEIIACYDALAEARRELPELERQIAEIDLREREELPGLEQRVSDLVDLTRSFGTLERMSNDLLTTINASKDLERDLALYRELQENSGDLNERIADARLQAEQTSQAVTELEEQRRTRPRLQARLGRLQKLRERLVALRQIEEQYAVRVKNEAQAEENSEQLAKVRKDLRESEQEMALVEAEAQQDQKRADDLEKRWRQLSTRRHLEEWRRLRGLAQGLAEAEQHVIAAHQRQDRLRSAYDEMHQKAIKWLFTIMGAAIIAVILGAGALSLFLLFHQPVIGAATGILALVVIAGAGLSLQNYTTTHKDEQAAQKQVSEGSNEVSMMVAARETARRMLGDSGALVRIEHEIQSLGGTVPRSTEEAEQQLRQISDTGESLADVQQQIAARRDAANASRNQVNVTMEAVATLRKARARLEEQRKAAGWDDIESKLRSDKIAIEDLRHEIAGLAGQEGLPIPVFETITVVPGQAPIPATTAPSIASLEKVVNEAINATDREIVALDSKVSMMADRSQRLQTLQDALDRLLERKRALDERGERFQAHDPEQQIEQAREQQAALSSALQSLQDSLRQRVRSLGVSFGQTAITSAEMAARRQLEALHITLGSRVELQKRRDQYVTTLKESQDALAEHYNRLAKFSATLGSWIIPGNPFAEILTGMRTRCQQEIIEADERGITREFETMRLQENASKAKIELCRQEIENAQERIAAMLAQHHRPSTTGYRTADVVTVWPLIGQYAAQDRARLEDEQETLEQELDRLEEQELALGIQLHIDGVKLDLDEARAHMEKQQRLYEARKRGGLLLQAVRERLMQKMQPRIEYYLQQLVPLLTSGRYHDVHLVGWLEGEDELQLRVWDSVAEAYINKAALSAGAADQLSLALRLAFAISSLPRELRAAPGFLILDEPLNNADRKRTRALAHIVTGESLGQHFEQILLVSQSSAFEPSTFSYHLSIDGGDITASNLPTPPAEPANSDAAPADDDDSSTNGDKLTPMQALPTTPVPEEIVAQ
jgi:DNA repair exonuclease SbcCD ATPase subunit